MFPNGNISMSPSGYIAECHRSGILYPMHGTLPEKTRSVHRILLSTEFPTFREKGI